MREIPGTITDRGLDHLFRPELTPELGMNHYQSEAAATAIYPRVYTEGQVKQVVFDVIEPWLDDAETAELIFERISKSLDKRETPFNRLVYPILGLVAEAGELANKAKKIARDKDGQMDLEAVEDGVAELGDIQWYVAAIATELGTKLSKVGNRNLRKLFSRKQRGVLGGSGDNR